MPKFKLSKQQLSILNRDLADLQAIKEDIEQAEAAGVPNMDEMKEVCNTCEERIKKLKASFAKGDK